MLVAALGLLLVLGRPAPAAAARVKPGAVRHTIRREEPEGAAGAVAFDVAKHPIANQKPLIGVLTQPCETCPGK